MRYAILFRGEAYRWGCDANGVALQHAAVASHVSMIAEPLEQYGHSVRTFFTYDHRVCKRHYIKQMRSNRAEHSKRPGAEVAGSDGGDNTTLEARHFYSEGSPDAIQALAAFFAPKRVACVAKIGNVKDQPDSIIGSLDAFLHRKRTRLKAGSSHASVEWYLPATLAQDDESGAFDFLIITRYDVSAIGFQPATPRPFPSLLVCCNEDRSLQRVVRSTTPLVGQTALAHQLVAMLRPAAASERRVALRAGRVGTIQVHRW